MSVWPAQDASFHKIRLAELILQNFCQFRSARKALKRKPDYSVKYPIATLLCGGDILFLAGLQFILISC
jgi:hypothetical protein